MTKEVASTDAKTKKKGDWKVKRRKYDPNDPALRMILTNTQKNRRILGVFFEYDDGPPRTLTSVELVTRA